MLDAETKRRIDASRDVLVGQVPNPIGQVEQITMALLYKFMDAIDKKAVENGGKPSFFVEDYEKFSWSELMSEKLEAAERLALYREGVEGMSANPNLPSTFQGIFKGAFLSFNDARTLRLFLTEVDGINTHSEDLGDAFEYLLSVLGSQGEAGQFRTPRHIIDFMVEVVSPKKNERILDPACGTAGFLISAQKHIYRENSTNGKNAGDKLAPAEKEKLAKNIVGYEISPDMARLSLANMYLHGLKRPQIKEYDTLTSDAFWEEDFDVILANPPFMTPRGGITPHKRFAVNANRTEVLFVDYIAEHLTVKGRAGIVVPEGIIFQSANAYKSLRENLVNNWGLWAVVSLPAGVFNPYAGVKTSILFIDKQLAKKTDEILFLKVENDGFDLGAQRRPIDKDDLPKASEVLTAWKQGKKKKSNLALWVKKEKIAEEDNYNLTGDRYGETIDYSNAKWETVKLGEVAQVVSGQSPEGKYYNEVGDGMPFYQGKKEFTEKYVGEPTKWTSKVTKIAPKGSILMSVRAPVGPVNITSQEICIGRGLASISGKSDKIEQKYLYHFLKDKEGTIEGSKGAVFSSISKAEIEKIQIPLPPLKEQKRIVAEIEAEQKAVDECRKLIEIHEKRIADRIGEVWGK